MTNETLKNYLNYLIIKGYNEETSHTRTGQVREFLDFTKLSFEQINEEHINQYYYYLKRNGITSVSGPNGSKKPNYIIPLPESETDNRRD